jgi:hypothetical protein
LFSDKWIHLLPKKNAFHMLYQYNQGYMTRDTCRHVAPFRHIILIPSRPYFALAPQYCVHTIEAANTCTSFIVLGLPKKNAFHMLYQYNQGYMTRDILFYMFLIWTGYRKLDHNWAYNAVKAALSDIHICIIFIHCYWQHMQLLRS